MQVNLEGGIDTYRIHAYEDKSITIAIPKRIEAVPEDHHDIDEKLLMWRDELYNNFIMMPDKLIRNWSGTHFEHLTCQDFEELSKLQPEIVLLGTGKILQRPSAAILSPLINAGIGIEIMDTGAACRTYNILMGDERRVAVVLMIS